MTETVPGTLRLGIIGGAAVYVHWSSVIGGMLLWLFLGDNWRELPSFCAAYVMLVVVHEAGHFAAAKLVGLRVYQLVVSGAGGICRFDHPKKLSQGFWVVISGLWAQAILLLATLVFVSAAGYQKNLLGSPIVDTFVWANAFLIIMNLIPSNPSRALETDGFIIWLYVKHKYFGGESPYPVAGVVSPVLDPGTSLRDAGFKVPVGCKFGLEFLNDDVTPMGFVVHILTGYVGLGQRDATATMMKIHNDGGCIVSCKTEEEAALLASEINDEALKQGFPLTCRAIKA